LGFWARIHLSAALSAAACGIFVVQHFIAGGAPATSASKIQNQCGVVRGLDPWPDGRLDPAQGGGSALCAGFCAAVAGMCRFLTVLRSRSVPGVRKVQLENVRLSSYLPD
jgi:hypothetical protein